MKLATSGLLLASAIVTLSTACKPRQENADSSTKDISDTESVENNYDGTFRVRCADGRLEGGKQVAIVPKPQLQHVCEQNDPNFHHGGGPGGPGGPANGGGGGGTNGGNGGNGGGVTGLTLDSCPNATDQMKKLNFAFSADMMPSTDQPAVQKLKFCNGFVTAFGAFLANSQLLFNFLVGDNPNQNGVLIAVGPQTQIVKYDSFGMLSLPWDVKAALPSIVERMKEQGVTFFLSFSGIRTNVKVSDLTGWVPCYNRPYSDTSSPNDMLAACTKANILIGCGQTSSQVLFVAAEGLRGEVFKDVGSGQNAVNNHNGVDFYFNPQSSMGFATQGSGVTRSTCDTASNDPESRMCWHMSGSFGAGYRCGAQTSTNDASWTRYVMQAD